MNVGPLSVTLWDCFCCNSKLCLFSKAFQEAKSKSVKAPLHSSQKLSLFHLFQAVEGTGLAFIVYSEAIKNMPLSQLWSLLYFFMLLLLGMGSMLGNVTAIITPLRDFKIFSHMSTELLNGKVQADIDWKCCHHYHHCGYQPWSSGLYGPSKLLPNWCYSYCGYKQNRIKNPIYTHASRSQSTSPPCENFWSYFLLSSTVTPVLSEYNTSELAVYVTFLFP